MTADLMPDRAEITGLLDEYAMLTSAINETKRRREHLRERILQFMELENETELHDGEHDVTVRLKTRAGTTGYDVLNMPDALVLKLKNLAALDVNNKTIKALEDRVVESLDVKSFELPGKESVALVVVPAAVTEKQHA
jgi:Asp-tRNA(Asn)/Glu-tRNA(Gln) amidotransferase B subunit